MERVLLEGADGDAADAGGGLSRGEESRVLCQVMADRLVIYTDPDQGLTVSGSAILCRILTYGPHIKLRPSCLRFLILFS